jgi:hypothetical protein
MNSLITIYAVGINKQVKARQLAGCSSIAKVNKASNSATTIFERNHNVLEETSATHYRYYVSDLPTGSREVVADKMWNSPRMHKPGRHEGASTSEWFRPA